MATGITCRLLVDGARFLDGSPGDPEDAPNALSGLSIKWGRATTIDQPEPATCEFDVMDTGGSNTYLQMLRTGRTVEVDATGTHYGAPETSTFLDPGFQDTQPGSTPPSVATGGTVTVVDDDGDHHALILPAAGGRPATVVFAPAPFSTTADAWDQIPATSPGQQWSVGARVLAPAGTSILLAPAYFSRPTGAHTLGTPIAAGTGTGDWMTLAGTVVPQRNGEWVGVQITVAGLPRWIDLDDGADTDTGDPVTVRTNLVPRPRSTAGWYNTWGTGGAGTAAVVADARFAGGQARKMTWTTPATAWGTSGCIIYQSGFAIPAGALVVRWRIAWDGWGETPPDFRVYSGAGMPLVSGTLTDLGDGTYEFRASLSAAAAGTLTYSLALQGGLPVAGSTLTASEFLTETASTFDGSYFDGGTPATGNRIFSWTGAVNNSTSIAQMLPHAQSWADTPGSWLDYAISLVDDIQVLAPAEGTERTATVFTGRITDLTAQWDESFPPAGGTRIHVTAADFTADLDNINVGDEPWPVQPMEVRFRRILELSGYDVEASIDSTVAGVPISYQDVDNQPATGLLQDLAQSVDGILWAAVHATTGPYLWVEDPRQRTPLYTLQLIDGVVQIVTAGGDHAAQDISACDVLRDPVQWTQTVSDVSTRVAVIWLEQGVDEDGHPETTERTLTVIDAGLEEVYGTRRISLTTMLADSSDATRVAEQLLARTSITGWRATGFTIDDPTSLEVITDDTISMMMRLLDGTTRIGLPIRLTGLPSWSPGGTLLPAYLEGGEYSYDDGAWTLGLTVSSAQAQGRTVPWERLDPDWGWDDFAGDISWLDLAGVDYTPPLTGVPE